MSYFLADDSHFSSGYISFHYSTQQASATAGTQQLSLYLNASLVPFLGPGKTGRMMPQL